MDRPIDTDARVDGDCWRSGGRVECTSGESFEADPDAADGGVDAIGADGLEWDGRGTDAGEDTGPTEEGAIEASSGVYGDYRSPCERVGTDEVICADGRTATVPDGVPDDAECQSEMVAGIGRRIVCEDTRVMPDQPENTAVECVYRDHPDGPAVTCSDGTIVTGDQVPVDDCEPTVERRGNEVLEISCGDMTVERELGPCERDWIIETRADAVELEQSGCTSVAGDIIARGRTCELERRGDCEVVASCAGAEAVTVRCDRPATPPRIAGPCVVALDGDVECESGHGVAQAVDPKWSSPKTLRLDGIDYVGGDLVVEDLPWLSEVETPGLIGIGGSLVIRRNPGLYELAGFEELEWVTEDVSISSHPILERWWPPLNLQYIDNAFLLSGNRQLDVVWARNNARMPPGLEIGGAAVVTDNDLSWCLATSLGWWLGARAGASRVYVGAEPTGGDDDCRKIYWDE